MNSPYPFAALRKTPRIGRLHDPFRRAAALRPNGTSVAIKTSVQIFLIIFFIPPPFTRVHSPFSDGSDNYSKSRQVCTPNYN
jgi:hypothetical protein